MKIYTKKGDKGSTSLMGGEKVSKSSLRVDAYGTIDELNSLIGVVLVEKNTKDILKKLKRIQRELFILGTDLATPKNVVNKIPRINKGFINRLEEEIDEWSKDLPELKNFILPGGGKTGSNLHLARTVARRVERAISRLSQAEEVNKNALIYINRLSDWFFVLARFVNDAEGENEFLWVGRKTRKK